MGVTVRTEKGGNILLIITPMLSYALTDKAKELRVPVETLVIALLTAEVAKNKVLENYRTAGARQEVDKR